MEYVLKFIKIGCLFLYSIALVGCGPKKGGDVIIGKRTMSRIISEIYLADQFINHNPDMRAQSDSMYVYPAIVEKYGYTIQDYENSIKYYLQDHDAYSRILKSSRQILDKRHDELEKLVQNQVEERVWRLEKWWGLDSTRKVDPVELKYDPLLRSIRWMVIPDETLQKWSMRDSAKVDIPQNPLWWETTANPPKREFSTFMVNETEVIEKNEKDSSKLRSDKFRHTVKKRLH